MKKEKARPHSVEEMSGCEKCQSLKYVYSSRFTSKITRLFAIVLSGKIDKEVPSETKRLCQIGMLLFQNTFLNIFS